MTWSKGTYRTLTLTALLTLLGACAAPSPHVSEQIRVDVEVVEPERFTDFGPRYGGEAIRRAHADALRSHLISRAAKLMQDGQALHIAILDVDMAGRIEPWHREFYGRVIRNVDPPRVRLQFQLTARDGSC